MRNLITIWIIILIGLASCLSQNNHQDEITPGAELTQLYFPQLKDKRVAVVANHTSFVDSVHLVDTLGSFGIDIKRIFSPEHGFRGEGEAGERMESYRDEKTGLSVISLYGNRKKPKAKHLQDVDLVIFDIQDVGVRFYTYISTMHYVMEACAETNTKFLVLDRPNPNGFYIDGPLLDTQYQSFVGLHPIPIVYGMTIAELGRMINNEGWLKNGIRCDYEWISCRNYSHDSLYQLPIHPSPNLPNMKSVYLYPSLCLFEGTVVSVGRGTGFPFQVFGHPEMRQGNIEFTPKSIEGASKNPKYKGQLCQGFDLRNYLSDSLTQNPRIRVDWMKFAYKNIPVKDFFRSYFLNLTGTDDLREQLKKGVPANEIHKSWSEELAKFKTVRKKYLIYEDFIPEEHTKHE